MAWSTLAEEAALIADLEHTGRCASVTIGVSAQGRPIRMLRIGAPPPEPEARAVMLIVGGQHGNEPAGREGALRFAQHLCTTIDPAEVEFLTMHGVHIVPTLNPDGIATGSRTNGDGMDLNRHHLDLSAPETAALGQVLGAVRPFVVLDLHEFGIGYQPQDVLLAEPRWPAVNPRITTASFDLIGAVTTRLTEQWTVAPYPEQSGRHTGMLAVSAGLRNAVAMLMETRRTADTPEGREDRIDRHVTACEAALEYVRERHQSIVENVEAAAAESIARGAAGEPYNTGAGLIDPAPVAYRITAAQAAVTASHRSAFNIALGDDLVSMAQAAQPLIPLLFDAAISGALVAGERIFDLMPPAPPPGEALPAGTFSPIVTWYGCDLLTGRIIAELPDTDGNISRLLGAYTSANLSLPIPNGKLARLAVQATVPMRTMIVAVVNNQPCWAGIVLTRQRGTGATMGLATATPEAYLNRRIVRDHNWDRRDEASVIAAGLVADAGDIPGVGSGIGLEVDAPPTGRTRIREYAAMDRATVYDRLRELMGVRGGPEFTIEPMWGDDEHTRVRLVVRIRSRIGIASTQPRAVFESAGASSAEYVLTEDYSDGKGATYVVASSSGEGEDKPTSRPAIATTMLDAGWPIVERHFEPGSNISQISTLNDHAQRELELLAQGASVWEISARWNVYPSLNIDWRIGDDVAWNLTGHGHPGGTTGTGRCIGWELRPSEGTVSPILLNPQEGTV